MAPSIKINKLYAAGFFTLLHQQGARVAKYRKPHGVFKVWWEYQGEIFYDEFANSLWDKFQIPEDNCTHLEAQYSDKLLEKLLEIYCLPF